MSEDYNPSAELVKPSAPEVTCSTTTGTCSSNPILKTPLGTCIMETLMWRNLVRSAITFVAINTVFLLILRGGFSFLTLTSYGLLIVFGVCAAYVLGTMGYQHYVLHKAPENPLQKTNFQLPRDSFVELGGMIGDLVNAILLIAGDVFFLRNFSTSAWFTFSLLFLAWLGKKARLTAIFYFVTIVLFIWPRLYHEQHEFIDKYAGIAWKYIVEYIQKGIAIAKEKAPAKIGPFKIKNA